MTLQASHPLRSRVSALIAPSTDCWSPLRGSFSEITVSNYTVLMSTIKGSLTTYAVIPYQPMPKYINTASSLDHENLDRDVTIARPGIPEGYRRVPQPRSGEGSEPEGRRNSNRNLTMHIMKNLRKHDMKDLPRK